MYLLGGVQISQIALFSRICSSVIMQVFLNLLKKRVVEVCFFFYFFLKASVVDARELDLALVIR